ncbi:hypothetical protein KSP40_PGU019668 [Platanthera guangdongensis]|uniref:Uncharacterized protein n=1 Tax=Platanthera guangdongensis TaxID=2320717 RepID=A0ABR2M0S6_9ASPA
MAKPERIEFKRSSQRSKNGSLSGSTTSSMGLNPQNSGWEIYTCPYLISSVVFSGKMTMNLRMQVVKEESLLEEKNPLSIPCV